MNHLISILENRPTKGETPIESFYWGTRKRVRDDPTSIIIQTTSSLSDGDDVHDVVLSDDDDGAFNDDDVDAAYGKHEEVSNEPPSSTGVGSTSVSAVCLFVCLCVLVWTSLWQLLLRLITWPFFHAQDSPPRPPFLFCLLDLFLIGGWSEPFSVFLLSCGREVFTTRKYPLRLVSMGSQGSHSSRCAIQMPPFAPSGGVPRKTMFIAFILCLKSVVMHKTTH
jgi:hypothetical protein